MIVKILGILDIFIGICFWLFGIFNIIPNNFIMILGLILLVKGVVFVINLNIISILDIISGLIIILGTSIALPKIVIIVLTLFLLQKGVFSLLS